MKNSTRNQSIWEERYSKGEVLNKYPYDMVVSFIFRAFPKSGRSEIKILDYGAGGGNHTVFLAEEGFDYYAIDYSLSAINHIRQRLEELDHSPTEKQLICQDFEALPYDDNFFDAVIDRQSLDQNRFDKIGVMVKEIRRVLKPGGTYFGINFSAGDPNLRYGKTLGNNDYDTFTDGTFKGLGQRHFFSETEIKELFHDFVIIDIRIKKITSLLFRDSGSEEMIVTARKPS